MVPTFALDPPSTPDPAYSVIDGVLKVEEDAGVVVVKVV